MPAFAFSLQRVLDFRRLEEGWAKDALRLAREAREDAEIEVAAVRAQRDEAMARGAASVAERLGLEAYFEVLGRDEASARNRVAILEADETRARDEWQAARAAAEALDKLRDKALEAWQAEEARREQADLDEWAVMRR